MGLAEAGPFRDQSQASIVIQADQLKTDGNHTLIAKHFNGVTGEDCPHSIPYMPLRPVLSIVMISKAGKDPGSQGVIPCQADDPDFPPPTVHRM